MQQKQRRGINFILHSQSERDIARGVKGIVGDHCASFLRAAGQRCYELGTYILTLGIMAQLPKCMRSKKKWLGLCVGVGVLEPTPCGWKIRDFSRDAVNMTPQQIASYRETMAHCGRMRHQKRPSIVENHVSNEASKNSNLAPVFSSQTVSKNKGKDPTCTTLANEKATAVPTHAAPPDALQHAGINDRSVLDLVAGAFARYQRHAAEHPEEARQAPFRPRRVAAPPRATPPQAKTPQRQIEAPGPPPPTPPPNEHEILEALLDMDVDEKDWGTRDRVRGMIVKGKIERLCLENAAYEYRMRLKDPTRDAIRCPEKWLIQRLPAGQAKLEALRRAVGMVATFGETKAGVRQCPHGQESPQEKAPHPVAGTG